MGLTDEEILALSGEELRVWYLTECRAKYTQSEIDDMGAKGEAFGPDDDGHYSYPVGDVADLKNAIKAVGRGNADHDAIRKYIAGRAKSLDETDLIPDNWNADGSLKDESKKMSRSVEWRMRRAKELRGSERRARLEKVEIRETSDGNLHLSGYASVTESPYDMGWYSESISRGAFKNTLSQSPDVQLLVNHAGLPLARTKSGTLQLSEDNTGLRVEADLDPEDPDVQSLSRKMQRGDIDQMSFAFRTIRQSWNDDYTNRQITELDIHRGDVSVVNQGANPATSTSIRSDDATRALRHMGALGLIDAFYECREGATLSAEALEYLAQAVAVTATDDAELEEVRAQIAERATPKGADAKVMDALNAMAKWCTEAIACQSKDPDNNTDPDDAAVWKALEAIHTQILAAIKLQAKDGTDDVPAPASTEDDNAESLAAARNVEMLSYRQRVEAARHTPRRAAA